MTIEDADRQDSGCDGPVARYQRVKSFVLDRIASGELRPQDRVPSENELVAALGVSRMTVNRALRELTAEGRLSRIAGVGTFVAAAKPEGQVLEIRNIADEIRARGGRHDARVHVLAAAPAPSDLATGFDVAPNTPLFHSVIVHRENGRPLQLEDRWVNPACAPDYLSQDFTRTTPSEHLLVVAPLQQVEHQVEAVMPDGATRRLLEMTAGEPCLLLRRRTWAAGRVASLARLWFPGGRYRLGGRFAPP